MGYLDYAGLQYLWSKLKEKFAPKSHSHDDRYYTESEMDGKLNSKVNNNEAGANGLINKLSTADGIPNDATVFISQHNDGKTASYYRRPISTLWTYIKSKADSVYQPKGSYAASSHTHDDRYYTETEINSKLNGKAVNITLSKVDLNTVKTPGFYNAGGGNGCTNVPVSDAFGLIVTHNANGEYYTQIFFLVDKNTSYRRYCNGGTWSGWTQDKYTDTNTWRGIQNNLTSDSTSDSLSAAQGKALKALVDGKASSEHTHGLNSSSLTKSVDNATTNSWDMVGGNKSFLLRSLRMQSKAPDWLEGNYAAGIAFGGSDTKGVISHAYSYPSIKFAGGNGAAPVWWLRLTGTSGKSYDLNAMPYASSAGATSKLSPFIKTTGEVKDSNSWFRVARFDLYTINTSWNNTANMWANWTQLRASFLIEGRYAKSGVVNVLAETTGNISVVGQANPKGYYAKNRISIKLNCYGVDPSYIEARAAISNDNHMYVDFWVRNGEYNTTSVYCLGRNNDSSISLITNFSVSSSVTSPDYTYYDCIYLKTSYGDSIVTKDILPVSNNSGSIGTLNNKWNTVFATTFNGKATSAGTADVANSVDWFKVQNKPATYVPAAHTHDDRYYTETEINSKLDGKSNTGHTHDDRYYTETEINTKLNGKANSSHTHTKSQITDFPTSLKNPTALTIQTNGAIAATYDGSAAKTVNITKSNIGLGNVDNTADANKSVKYATSAGSASTATKATTAGTADKANSVDWSKVQNKPSSYPPSSHSHAYLPLGGGTISGQIKRDVGCSWIYDRDNAIVYGTSSGTSTGYHPVIGQKTPSGAWTIGTYSDERLIFDYTTDANKTAGTNNGTQVYLPAQAGTIITSATIGSQSVNYANSAGNATNAANATTATKLSSNAGSSVQPVYFSGGKPVAIGYTISSSVPANAKFTDTTYGVASSSSNGLMSSTDKTKLDDFSRVINIQKQIKLTTDWLDTGIAGNSLDTGTYVVQVSGFNSSHTQLYSEIYSGVMSWYSGTTNSGNSSEIFLHNAGLADNNNAIYLRTLRVAGSKTLKLQIACKVAATGTDTLTFKFRRLI